MIQKPYTKISVPIEINGEVRQVDFRPADTLLSVLRNQLSLTGPKPGCLNGDCGACSVIVNDTVYKSCIMLAIEAIDAKITTIEGLHDTPIQKAFVKHFAFQCGYCTPGFIMNCHALLQKYPQPTYDVIKEWLSSNICRCTCYQEIEEAVLDVIENRE
ncbi:aerobic-type carbon monoxide dehydrogenase, small subunit CoxS/CutS-like protein [Schinkia azotoformans MEV2011]|uniref:Aerobic-type carbon monoxide dehydrogenase, small subunit CoxS/CutS-like protein n=1 Tax=Schinkia azotoformans MEV2011 TaxID=1348973 RepID=A0A072P156_SCHAZ|nr:(2Fe-2S)-binding protein [Schinkia azotoformans]KEF39220.1 aerobic-type carbon monoxide dehydrogenase, small subunit CoxS/CutS-like protein [Schinkia azotoformans MEV2011]MEC1695887.1 (2Fe-2S)-binding protein [Schinkia azotoformans]MEC1717050.1 (2Fe-2S)-binding protein [Schinkia azotoformans]MEC1726043.1 (2Fe-2S)-binding protein [Schinkia azotoformans]MEC1741864.1 (2Fe-2S)-binding protein [Schinkia azotoformans]